MEILFFVGQVLFGGFFVINGFNHLAKSEKMAEYAKSKYVPIPKFAVIFSGLLIIFGGFGILLGSYIGWAVFAIVLFLLPVSLQMHSFWLMKDSNQKEAEMANFLKNMALIGASLMILSIPLSSWVINLF